MTLADLKNYIFRRTKTNATSFAAADMVIALNNANERVLSIIRNWTDVFLPTAWTTSDLSTGTATPIFDADFHELVGLWPSYQYTVDAGLENAVGIFREIQLKEATLLSFYGGRNFRVCTVTIASPGVFTKVNHNFCIGDRVILSTTGALPTGLSTNTVYFVVAADTDTFQVSATNSGTAINTSGTQSGTHYVSVLKGHTLTTKSINFR